MSHPLALEQVRTYGPMQGPAASSTFPTSIACCRHPQPHGMKSGGGRPSHPSLPVPAKADCSCGLRGIRTTCSNFSPKTDSLEVITSLHFRKPNPELQLPSFKCSVLYHLQQRNHFFLPQQALPSESVSRLRHSLSSSLRRSENKASTTHAVCSSKVAIAACLPTAEWAETPPQLLLCAGELCLWILASFSQNCTHSSFWEEYGPRLLPWTAQHTNICSNCRHSSYGCGLVSK